MVEIKREKGKSYTVYKSDVLPQLRLLCLQLFSCLGMSEDAEGLLHLDCVMCVCVTDVFPTFQAL